MTDESEHDEDDGTIIYQHFLPWRSQSMSLVTDFKNEICIYRVNKVYKKVKKRLPPPKILKVVKEPSKLSPPSNFPKWAVELRFIKI